MGEIVPVPEKNMALALAGLPQDPEAAAAEYEKRIKEAQELEAKLNHINEILPTRVYNVCSSSAGAGSSDFHHYRMIRKAEQERVRRMEADWQKQQKEGEYKAKMEELQKQADERTAKKRAKRQNKKNKKKKKSGDGDADAPGAGAGQGQGSDDSDSEDERAADLD